MWKSKSMVCSYWVFLLQLLFQFVCMIAATRKEIGFPNMRICRTTVQGRYLLSDDNGYVCDALSLDPQTRCCPERGAKFSCHGCDALSQCCNSYEFCVSCCLHPARTQKEQILKVKIAKPSTSGTYQSVFNYCAGRCRHNSESVVHENAYVSEFHHCFSLPSNSSRSSVTPVEARLNGINVIVGRQGESCESVCKLNGESCVLNKLLVLNQCDIIQKYMSCKGGCLASVGSDQPAEVADDAPKHLNPGVCLYTQTQSTLSCDGSHRHTRSFALVHSALFWDECRVKSGYLFRLLLIAFRLPEDKVLKRSFTLLPLDVLILYRFCMF